MKTVKLQREDIKKENFFVKCPFCKEKINGTTLKHLNSNLEIHLNLKHKNEEQNEMKVVE